MSPDEIAGLVTRLRDQYNAGLSRPIKWRRRQLRALRQMFVERETAIAEALAADLGKSPLESYLSETGLLISEVDHTLRNLTRWIRPESVSTPLALQPGRSRVVRSPLGVALILSTWNYPVLLALSPLIPCIAAGNCAILKPSEVAPATSAVLARLLPDYLDPDCFAVVEGGVDVSTSLLEQRFDKIFYTGSTRVGRIVMEAAAKHLTPVTLELGGKSPCLVGKHANLKVAARRIVAGKYLNAGQTCVAPDYVLVHREREPQLLELLVRTINDFYGEDPKQSGDFGRIINTDHFDRLLELAKSGRPVNDLCSDREERYISPTVLTEVSPESPLMQEEIFGPLLPVLAVDDMQEAISFVQARERPLSMYVFTKERDLIDQVIAETHSGGLCINDTVMHLANHDLPFGGIGQSGMGQYHGRWGIEAFSQSRAVYEHRLRPDPPMRYPPFDEKSEEVTRWIMSGRPTLWQLIRRRLGLG
ncbi:MAG: aldehyde dehydrogenase family protein [Maioricimonas sp. JB045]